MPSQTPPLTSTAFYNQGDTWPPLVRQLFEGDGETPMDLTTAVAVTITIAHASFDHYYSPYDKIIDGDACAISDAENGLIQWTPQAGDLERVGTFHYTFQIQWPGGTQTVPPHTYEILVVRPRPGGES